MELAAEPELSSLLSEADGVYKLRTRVRSEIRLVQKELGSVQVTLSKIAEVPAYKLDEETKARAEKLRNLYFDIQHDVDNLRDRIRAHQTRMADLQGLKGFAAKISFKIASIWAGREFATSIREMKRRLQDSADLHVSHVMAEVNEPQLLLDTEDLVGIYGHRNYITNILTSSRQLKVVAIVGDGAVGKTTLAKVVYDDIEPEFNLKAWVTVSSRPDIVKILRSMLQQITQGDEQGDLDEMDPKQLIDKIRRTLEVKRYLIVIDNVLDEPECELLKCALIDNIYGSAVLMTSRKYGHIAYFVDKVYELQPLSEVDSRELFYNRLFGSEDKWPSYELGEIYEKFLKTCGGMPSNIITISRLLADKISMTRDELSDFFASIYTGLLFDQTTIGRDLPQLKTCLLYLSLFPKGCEVNGEHLIWKWLAEGFIHEKESEGKTSQEQGELYLKKLWERDLIEPVDVDADDRVLYWTVKEHELIIAMSTQENFVTVLSSHVQGRPMSSMVKRLSIQGSNVEHQQLEGHLSQVKSLVVSGDTNWIPSLLELHDLRVLDLGASQSLQNDDIKDIGSLFHLKCLIIGGKYITHIPDKIGDLLFLETLDLKESGVIELPERIFQIKQLKRLYVNSSTNIPKGIGKLEALLELGDIKISEPNFLKELHNLTKLSILKIAIWSWEDEKLHTYQQQLLENLRSLVQDRKNIQSLSILTCCSTDFMDTMAAEWAPSSLKKLEIRYGIFDKFPNWIGSLQVSSLSIEVNELSQDMVNMLGKLDNLCSLSLTSKHEPKGKFGTDPQGFGKLESLQIVSNVMVKIFEQKEGAMLNLKRLMLRFQASLTETENQDFSFGFERLWSLEQLDVQIICFNASHGVVNKAEFAIREAKYRCPTLKNLKIRRVQDQAQDQKEAQEVKDQSKEEIMTMEAGKQTVEKGESSGNGQEKNLLVVCFNCGEIGHFSSVCSKPKMCFVCHRADHVVDLCPDWQKTAMAAQYSGGANNGLGFYHIDVEPRDNGFSHLIGMDNFWVFTIEEGEIDVEGILENLRELVDRDWAWQLRKIDEYSYIVRFPPHKKVENLVIGKASLFHLNKESVVASLKVWNGDVEPIGSLIDVWVQIKGIPPKWVDWGSVRKVASTLGLMVEVDWQSLFDSFFSLVRVKIQCKDPTKVPKKRIFVLKKQLYLISFKTEGFQQKDNSSDDGSGKDSGEEEPEEEDPLEGKPKEKTKN